MRHELTIHELFKMPFQICFRTLAPRTNGHSVVFIRITGGTELVQVRSCLVLADDEEPNTIWPTTVFLRVHLSLCFVRGGQVYGKNHAYMVEERDILSAMEETMRLTGMRRLKNTLSLIACCRM